MAAKNGPQDGASIEGGEGTESGMNSGMNLVAKPASEVTQEAVTLLTRNYQALDTLYNRRQRLEAAAKAAKKVYQPKQVRSAESLLLEARRRWKVQRIERRLGNYQGAMKVTADPDQYKCLLVVRNETTAPTAYGRKILGEWGLIHNGRARLLRNNDTNLRHLRMLQRYVYWGGASLELIRRLITTHAWIPLTAEQRAEYEAKKEQENLKKEALDKKLEAKGLEQVFDNRKKALEINKPVRPLASNLLVEEIFADLGHLCLEDLVHEFHTGGENIEEVNARLVPFVFSISRKDLGPGERLPSGCQDDIEATVKKFF